ncbi:MAG TPA: hypothetical protein VGQ78_02220 [Vicinamibacteria bacterium]|nr:hypothetical protein [Vicinamibacteria bacterium]
MGGRAARDEDVVYEPPPSMRPPWAAAVALALVLALLLSSNGRPIGAGDTRPTERVAASLVQEHDFDLDEYPEVEPPFAREVAGHRVSVYPVLSAVMAAPVFAAAGAAFALDETGSALAGKVAASLFSALAGAVFFLVLARRHPLAQARWTALVFALGTTIWSTSQALWQHPAAVLFICVALLFAAWAEEDAAWAGRAGLPLALAVAARHADVALAAALAAAIGLRWRRQAPWLALWASPAVAFVLLYDWRTFGSPLQHGFSDSLSRFSEPWGVGHVGLLASPAKGLFVFTPMAAVALAGFVRAWRLGERWWPAALAAAALAHWVLIGRWSEWHGGESWGPRLMTDALPLLLFFLPEAQDTLPLLTRVAAALSIAVQALGAFAYDYSWERIHQRVGASGHAELWDVAGSPIVYYARRRALYLDAPGVKDGRALIHEHPLVPFGRTGSQVTFAGDAPTVSGTDRTLGDVFLQRGARVEGARAKLKGRWDGIFLRVRPEARARTLELRVQGRGHGTLYVGEKTFWTEPRWTVYPMAGAFGIRHPYRYAESGGADVTVTLGRSPGEAEIDSLSLVPSAPAPPRPR